MARKPKVKLYLRFRTQEGKQSPYCPAVYDSKSRIRNFWCLVNGKPEFHPNGYYYQRVKRDTKEKWESLGTDPNAASSKATAQANKEAFGTEDVPRLKANQPEQPAPAEKAPGYRLDDEVREYLKNAAKLAPKTYKAVNSAQNKELGLRGPLFRHIRSSNKPENAMAVSITSEGPRHPHDLAAKSRGRRVLSMNVKKVCWRRHIFAETLWTTSSDAIQQDSACCSSLQA